MAQGEIGYVRPLSAAIERTKTALFRPFKFDVWIVVGFTSWLAWLGQHGGWGGGGKMDAEELRNLPSPRILVHEALQQIRSFLDHWLVLLGVVTAIGMVLVIVVVVVAVSSWAKFVFLENVTKGHTLISEPLSRASSLGWSLFWWRLIFAAVVLSFFGSLAAFWWLQFAVPFLEGNPITVGALVWVTSLALPLMIVFAYVDGFLEHFVVPIMAKHQLSASAAWGRFLGLFRQNPVPFLLYGLLLIPLWLLVAAAILLFGLLTCCIGWILLALPYIGMVLSLPIYYTYRAMGPEFLAQFGPEWDCR